MAVPAVLTGQSRCMGLQARLPPGSEHESRGLDVKVRRDAHCEEGLQHAEGGRALHFLAALALPLQHGIRGGSHGARAADLRPTARLSGGIIGDRTHLAALCVWPPARLDSRR